MLNELELLCTYTEEKTVDETVMAGEERGDEVF
jgi:hypothetical protein